MEREVEIKAPVQKFLEMVSHKPHHIKDANQEKVHGCDLIEGVWGKKGSIICWHYTVDGKRKRSKQIIEDVDLANNLMTFKVIEGELMEEYNEFIITIQATPKDNGESSVVCWTLRYEKKHENIADPETLVQFFDFIAKDIASHITTQPLFHLYLCGYG